MGLRETIQEIARGEINRQFGIPAKVVAGSYDPIGQTIDVNPVDKTADYLRVQLQAEVASGILLVPADGSTVIIEQISAGKSYVSLFGAIQEIIILDGTNGGVVKVTALVASLNGLQADFNIHTHAAALTPPVPLTAITTAAELENPNFKH